MNLTVFYNMLCIALAYQKLLQQWMCVIQSSIFMQYSPKQIMLLYQEQELVIEHVLKSECHVFTIANYDFAIRN